MLTNYQIRLKEKYLAAPRADAPEPWKAVGGPASCIAVGGLQGVGFGVHPDTGVDLLMVVSMDGFGLIDTETSIKIASHREPDPDVSTPEGTDLACPGIGVLTGTRVPIAGLIGGGLHATTEDGWTVDVVAPGWPHHRMILSADGGGNDGPPGTTWWHVFDDERHGTLRAAGFSPSGEPW